MKRYLFLLVPVLVQATWAWADGPAPRADAERSQQLHANLDLIRSLVKGGVELANQDDPLKRAGYCNAMAERFADQISLAADGRDAARLTELGNHFHALLQRGVASNFREARRAIREGSAEERELFRVHGETAAFVADLERHLQRALDDEPRPEVQRALQAVQDGRQQVDSAIKGPGKVQGKPRGTEPASVRLPSPSKKPNRGG